MNTRNFRTRQEIAKTFKNPKAKKYVIGLDIGYSSVKCFHENGYFCFPSYMKKLDDLLMPGDKDILYKDAAGDIYMLGYSAQEMIQTADTNDTESEFFSRKRYGSKMFKMLSNAALAIATLDKSDQKKKCRKKSMHTRKCVEKTQRTLMKYKFRKALYQLQPPAYIKVACGNSYTIDESLAITPPNGYYFSTEFFLSNQSGSYVAYRIGILNQSMLP